MLLSIPLDVTSRHCLSLNKTLRITPIVAGLARAAGLSGQGLSLEEMALIADTYMPKPNKRGPYKKKIA